MQSISFTFKYVLCLALLFGGAAGLFGQGRRGPAPPPVVAQNVTVRRGDTVSIPLEIHGVRGEQLEFLIRSQPKVGRVGKVVATDFNSATVTYTAPADAKPGDDVFTFAVRGRDGVSAPGFITVTIVAPPTLPPVLSAPNALAFPDAAIGETVSARLGISNRGGGILEGELKVSPPWSVEGQTRYRLATAQKAEFQLIFKPNKIGPFTGEATFGPEPEQTVQLTAQGISQIGVEPAKVTLAANPGSQTRRGVVTLTNRSNEPRKITVAAGPRLLMDATVEVPAHGKVDAAIFAEAVPPTGFADKLRLAAADGWKQEVPVEIAPVGPIFKVSKEVRPFPKTMAGERVEAIALLKNTGGSEGLVRLAVNSPFQLARADLVVAAGGDAEARVVAPGLAAGKYQATLVLDGEGLKEKVAIALEVAPKPTAATVAPPARDVSPAPVAAPARTEPQVVPVNQALAAEEEHPVPRPLSRTPGVRRKPSEMVNGRGFFVHSVEAKKAVLRWPAALGPTTQLSVERMIPALVDGQFQEQWLPLAGVILHADTDPLTAELPNLNPAQIYRVRVRSQDEPIFTVQFQTPAKKPWISMGWQGMTLTVLFLALGYLGWRLWKTRTRGGW